MFQNILKVIFTIKKGEIIMKNIYYVFENVGPTQDELKEQGCESLSEFIKDFSEESELLNDITYVNYYKHGESIENALGNEPTILSKIKYDWDRRTKVAAYLSRPEYCCQETVNHQAYFSCFGTFQT